MVVCERSSMRLGIRRKLIGTLILVGLFPLVMSLIVILGGGAAMQLSRIRTTYEDIAADCSYQITSRIRSELGNTLLLSRLPHTLEFVREKNRRRTLQGVPATMPGISIPQPNDAANELDRKWPGLSPTDPIVAAILQNPMADQLRLLGAEDPTDRQLLVTNAYGELIAADVKSGDFFQADEQWWQITYNEGHGRVYVSSLVINPVNDKMVIEVSVPVLDDVSGRRVVIGVIKEKLDVSWIQRPLKELPAKLGATGQLFDLDSSHTIFAPDPSPVNLQAEEYYLRHRGNPHVGITTLMFGNLVQGIALVPTDTIYVSSTERPQVPHWAVLVSKPSSEAMAPIYKIALMVAAIGAALILVLFILGVAISNREISMPILRLREATAAVGRGELNVRLMSTDVRDPTFRKDELGDLAHDFDEMTRQLQRNVNALARSNEAKRRFMELAGHELRTPVTYILGVCQLAQRQLQQEVADVVAARQDVATATRSNSAVNVELGKIALKAQRLSRIIDNLLKLVNNDQFTTRMTKAPVDIRSLLLQVTSDYRPFSLERRQQLIVDLAGNLASIEGDRDKLEDVFTNLLSNAIRFSPDGGVVKVTAHEVVGDMLEVLIEDSGPGISKEDLTNLFEPFYVGSDIMHHHSGEYEFGSKGIGLGLAIVRRFVELHGGVVRAQTTGHGTQFHILLPLNKEPMELPPPANS